MKSFFIAFAVLLALTSEVSAKDKNQQKAWCTCQVKAGQKSTNPPFLCFIKGSAEFYLNKKNTMGIKSARGDGCFDAAGLIKSVKGDLICVKDADGYSEYENSIVQFDDKGIITSISKTQR